MAEQARKTRCAVYTRKSTEDGLDQAFNSLDAQYEACAAYVASQRHEGWSLLPERYEDGGFSGGNMDRPGLKQLLAEVAAGRVDVIVIYKVDRLTRSLTDFAKIVEVLDNAKASFVSITQSFNTTTSMGRLTLNMLLSFAQFEREVTGERIRDKIAASKRKGLWMGGPVPLGYRVQDRRLVVVDSEAELIRHVMRRYLALGSVNELVDELAREGCTTKVQLRTSGPRRGGVPFRRGTLYHLLTNRIYLGEIVHKGVAHPGEHQPIVDRQLWDQVQAALAERGPGRVLRARACHPSLLAGTLVDGLGRPMTPTHANKVGGDGGSRRYRYYVTRPDQLDDCPAWRVSARDLEAIVRERVEALLLDRARIANMVSGAGGDAAAIQEALRLTDLAAATIRAGRAQEQLALITRLRVRVALHDGRVTIELPPHTVLEACGIVDAPSDGADPIMLTCEAVRVRRGHEVRLVIPGLGNGKLPPVTRDPKLAALLAEAHVARRLVLDSPGRSIARIAADAGRCRARMSKLLALSYLAPSIVTAIVEGRQPAGLSARTLLDGPLPIDWSDQRARLGFS